jgi:hypothetical protein
MLLVVSAVALLLAFAHRESSAKERGHLAGVTVAPHVLAQGEPFFKNGQLDGWSSDPAFLILPGDTKAAVDAVVAAGRRFSFINEYGREVTEDDLNQNAYYTPSWVGAYHSKVGVVLMADTKGDLPRAQGVTMIAILTEELSARGVTARIVAMPRHLELGEEIDL